MNKYLSPYEKEDHVEYTRQIQSGEWAPLDKKWEEINKESRSKQISSQKSSLEIKVK